MLYGGNDSKGNDRYYKQEFIMSDDKDEETSALGDGNYWPLCQVGDTGIIALSFFLFLSIVALCITVVIVT